MENSQWIQCAVPCHGNHRYSCALKADPYLKLVQSLYVLTGSSRWSCATGPFCLLALQGNEIYWAFFFSPRSYLPFLVHKCLCHICSLPSGTWWGGRSHSAQLLPKKVCLSDSGLGNGQEEQPVHQTGAAGGISVSHGCYTVCSLCSELLLTPSGDEQVRSISILSYVLLPKYSLPPFGPIYRRRWWEHTVRFCGTQIILSKVLTVTWLFSTTVKWTPAFKNHPVTVC